MSKHTEDIIMKSIMELFKGDAVRFFGIDKEIISVARTELSHVELQKNIADWTFLTSDNSFLHFEFQTTYKQEDLARFMVSDAMLYYKEGKRIRTVVVYSSNITNTMTTLDFGSINYTVEAFYMLSLDGDSTYESISAKVDAKEPLTKNDLMSIVFLPLMKNSVDKVTRIKQSIEISKKLKTVTEQLQIQAMLDMLAEKFIKDDETLAQIKEVLNMSAIAEMIREDAVHDRDVTIARNAFKEGATLEFVRKITGLDTNTLKKVYEEVNSSKA